METEKSENIYFTVKQYWLQSITDEHKMYFKQAPEIKTHDRIASMFINSLK